MLDKPRQIGEKQASSEIAQSRDKKMPVCPFIEHPKGCPCQAILMAHSREGVSR